VKIANSNNPAAIDPIVSDLILAFIMFGFNYNIKFKLFIVSEQWFMSCFDECTFFGDESQKEGHPNGGPQPWN
jgi:hypothetical protein